VHGFRVEKTFFVVIFVSLHATQTPHQQQQQIGWYLVLAATILLFCAIFFCFPAFYVCDLHIKLLAMNYSSGNAILLCILNIALITIPICYIEYQILMKFDTDTDTDDCYLLNMNIFEWLEQQFGFQFALHFSYWLWLSFLIQSILMNISHKMCL
jgi:hypothetical protein